MVDNNFCILCGAGLLVALSLAAHADEPSKGMTDPTQPLRAIVSVKSDSEKTGFTLQGIFIGENGRFAIINGRTAHVGDKVDGAQVQSIGDNRVLLANGDKSLELTVRQNILIPSPPEKRR